MTNVSKFEKYIYLFLLRIMENSATKIIGFM